MTTPSPVQTESSGFKPPMIAPSYDNMGGFSHIINNEYTPPSRNWEIIGNES